jgi:hypothetical protein
MTQPRQPLTDAEAVAAALMVYADAVKLGQVPVPNFITLHSAALPPKAFMTLADHMGALIEIVELDGLATPYARINVPFGAGILPTSIDATVRASTVLTDAVRRDIETHNSECVEVTV